MAAESRLRQSNYIRRGGCNVFASIGNLLVGPLRFGLMKIFGLAYAGITSLILAYMTKVRLVLDVCFVVLDVPGREIPASRYFPVVPKFYATCMAYTNHGYTYRQALQEVGLILPENKLIF